MGDMHGVSNSESELRTVMNLVKRAKEASGIKVLGLCNLLDVLLIVRLLDIGLNRSHPDSNSGRDEAHSIGRFHVLLLPEGTCLFLLSHPCLFVAGHRDSSNMS